MVPDSVKYGVQSDTPCGAISIDLLTMYLRPIECYLQYSLGDQIGVSKAELENARDYLKDFIVRKEQDEEDCTGVESLSIIRSLVDRIVKKNICL